MWAARSDSGRLGDGTRIFDRQTTFTLGNTLSFARGDHSLRVGGEFRRHHLDGDLQETRNRRHNFDDWFDFLTVGYADPADDDRARQIADSALSYGETVRGYRMTDWSWFVADDWKLARNLTVNLGVRHDYWGSRRRRTGCSRSSTIPRRWPAGTSRTGSSSPRTSIRLPSRALPG